jgi:hypothetical protein
LPPSLNLRLAAGTVTLSWTTAATGYQLLSAPAIAAAWIPVNQFVIQEDGMNKVSIPVSDATRFFRLHK